MDIRIGTSGWTYPHWRGGFYPTGLPHRAELEFLSERFRTVEINGSFYSLQRPSSYVKWRESTPAGFVFAVKGGRFITHNKKLRDVRSALANFLASGPMALNDKLGPILWQLPAMLHFQAERVRYFFALLPQTIAEMSALAAECDQRISERFKQEPVLEPVGVTADQRVQHAIEVRHPSYLTPEFTDLCREFGVAIVLADTAGKWPWIEEPTTEFGYFRLHGSRELYTSQYTDPELDDWAERLRRWSSISGMNAVYVYFDNDARSHAAFDAARLAARLSAGWAAAN